MGNLSNFIQIIVFALVILGPTIGAIAKKLKAHAEEKRIQAERQKRRIEAIRTGQVAGDSATLDPRARGAVRTAPLQGRSSRAKAQR